MLVASLIGIRAIGADSLVDNRAGSDARVRGEGLVGGVGGVDLQEGFATTGFGGVAVAGGVALGGGDDGVAGCVEGVASIALDAEGEAEVGSAVGELGAVFGGHIVLDCGAAGCDGDGVHVIRGVDLDAAE